MYDSLSKQHILWFSPVYVGQAAEDLSCKQFDPFLF